LIEKSKSSQRKKKFWKNLYQNYLQEIWKSNQKVGPHFGSYAAIVEEIDQKYTTICEESKKFETIAIRTQTPRTEYKEHSTPLFLTSSFVFDDAEHARALFADEVQGNIYVYTVDNQNKVNIKKIDPVVRLSNFYILENGLSKNDKIIFEGIQSAKIGEQVNPQLIPTPKL
jgi:hypothetical protein